MRVVGIQSAEPTASDFWRVGEPLLALNRRGHDCWLGRGHAVVSRGMPDVIVTSRQATLGGSINGAPLAPEESAALYHASRDGGPAMVWDVDDDFWSIEDDNPHRLSNPQVQGFEAMGRGAEVITTTTPYLAGVLAEHVPGPPVRVAPNLIDLSRFTRIDKPEGNKVVIGLQGGSHARDWRIVAEPLRATLARHPETLLRVIGDRPDWLDSLPAERVMHREFAPWHRWPDLLVGIDIGLAPLRPSTFNKSKSPIKWMEYAAIGAATICSPTVYENYVEDRTTAIVARTEADWTAALDLLVTAAPIRRYLADRALSQVQRFWTVDQVENVWLPIFAEAQARHNEPARMAVWRGRADDPRQPARREQRGGARLHAVLRPVSLDQRHPVPLVADAAPIQLGRGLRRV